MMNNNAFDNKKDLIIRDSINDYFVPILLKNDVVSTSQHITTENHELLFESQLNMNYQDNKSNMNYQEIQSNTNYQENESNMNYQKNESNMNYQNNKSNMNYQENKSNINYQENESNMNYQENESKNNYQENNSKRNYQQIEKNKTNDLVYENYNGLKSKQYNGRGNINYLKLFRNRIKFNLIIKK